MGFDSPLGYKQKKTQVLTVGAKTENNINNGNKNKEDKHTGDDNDQRPAVSCYGWTNLWLLCSLPLGRPPGVKFDFNLYVLRRRRALGVAVGVHKAE